MHFHSLALKYNGEEIFFEDELLCGFMADTANKNKAYADGTLSAHVLVGYGSLLRYQ